MRGVNLGSLAAWAGAVVVGVLLGAASAWASLQLGRSNFSEKIGAWQYSRAAGSVAADPYTRAIIAQSGLLALSAREARYYTLEQDGEGRPLRESCIYDLVGRALPARWWSVTLYASDDFLARNTDHAASIDSTDAHAGAGGAWRARIAPVRGQAANWISSRAAGRGFVLMLRVYNADDRWRASEDDLPRLETLSCAGEAP